VQKIKIGVLKITKYLYKSSRFSLKTIINGQFSKNSTLTSIFVGSPSQVGLFLKKNI
jgi:hypothetical protein